ncbi:MAG TPA: prepilin-type N-terminal cleavage/methylation domain-containing protein [Syntrophales bacterium]|nr:prepilin-type N-terminal cleavage/methylation domain-containing protein [Syntrophales bacterium]
MKCRSGLLQSGFTLIEIVVTVVIVAIFGSMILTFLSDSLIHSSDPVKSIRAASDLHMVMANITADYNRYPKWRTGTAYGVGNCVVPTIRNGHYYKCSTAGTSSNVNEPDWPLSGTKSDGTAAWTETVENGALPSLSILQNNINNKNYGTYDIAYNDFIQFVYDAETPGGNKILKVTITNNQGGNLTALFVSN